MNKKTILATLLLILSIGILSLNSPDAEAFSCVLVNPSSSGAITGDNYNLSATLTITGVGENVSHCTWATTADGVFANSSLGNVTNYYNFTTVSTLTETDSTTITLNCFNLTNGVSLGTCTATTVDIDNTNPSCSSLTIAPVQHGIKRGGIITYDISATDNTGLSYETNLTLDGSASNPTIFSLTGASNTFTAEQTNLAGMANMTATVTDQVNRTCQLTADLTIVSDRETPVVVQATRAEDEQDSNVLLIVAVLVIVVIVTAITIMLLKKKKR